MTRKIIQGMLIVGSLVIVPELSSAAVVFETDFEDVQDWTLGRPPVGSSYACQPGNCSGIQPPKKSDNTNAYDVFRSSPSWFSDPYITNMAEIKNGYGRESGRGLQYNVEVSGCIGSECYANGTPMGVWLGYEGYKDLYVRFYVKYSPGWKWTNDSISPNTAAYQKFLEFAVYNGTVGDGKMDGPRATTALGGELMPIWIVNWYQYITVTPSYTIFQNSERYAPDYSYNNATNDFHSMNPSLYPIAPPMMPSPPFPAGHQARSVLWPTDNEWHSYEFRARLNDVAGLPEGGLSEFWLDGIKGWSKSGHIWVKAGGSLERGWNRINILDNSDIASYSREDHMTMSMYIDDVAISTNYIGPDYGIGGVDATAPASPTGLSVE